MIEVKTYDILAQNLYKLRANGRKWTNWHHLKRKERDYWRGLAQIAHEDGLYTEMEKELM